MPPCLVVLEPVAKLIARGLWSNLVVLRRWHIADCFVSGSVIPGFPREAWMSLPPNLAQEAPLVLDLTPSTLDTFANMVRSWFCTLEARGFFAAEVLHRRKGRAETRITQGLVGSMGEPI